MLTKWRALSICQHLLGAPDGELEVMCTAALEAFASEGAGAACDKAFEIAAAAIRKVDGPQSALPRISREKRTAVNAQLSDIAAAPDAIERARRSLETVRESMRTSPHLSLVPGFRHRFELIVSHLEDAKSPEERRRRAAAAILYVEELNDVILDSLGPVGMLDDDYALRVVLEELSEGDSSSHLHWSERIASLWDELPFLQGVELRRENTDLSVSWLDRVNSFVSYAHVLNRQQGPLLLLQPSVACSPLHSIVTLIGLLVLDAVTSSTKNVHHLREGMKYEIDGLVVRYEGTKGARVPGWLRLMTRGECVVERPAWFADRMTLAANQRRGLSSFSDVPKYSQGAQTPMQQFFRWDAELSASGMERHLLLVASRQRALDLLEGIESNGIRLLEHGLVRFVGNEEEGETHGALLLVAPTLSAARALIGRGVRLQSILVDGFERLHRGRNDLPFLMIGESAPPIIAWSASGYYPADPPDWLPDHRKLEVSAGDLVGVLEMDDSQAGALHQSLSTAATAVELDAVSSPTPPHESAIADAIKSFVATVRESAVPDYWKYQQLRHAQILRLLVAATPTTWSEIRRYSQQWEEEAKLKWSAMGPTVVSSAAPIRRQEARIFELVGGAIAEFNARGASLLRFLEAQTIQGKTWTIVCERPEQARAADAFTRSSGSKQIQVTALRDLPICRDCIVAGWTNRSFPRRLWAHTPRSLHAFGDEADLAKWQRATSLRGTPAGDPMLAEVGGLRGTPVPSQNVDSLDDESDMLTTVEEQRAAISSGPHVRCVFVFVNGDGDVKVLARDDSVLVEDGDKVLERPARQVCADDRVILGVGSVRWSPADEFTSALVEATKESHPELIETSRAWRAGLAVLQKRQHMTTSQLRSRLAAVGVQRENQTLEGWLDLSLAAPIQPKGGRNELEAIWPLISDDAGQPLEDVVDACTRLRELRVACGRALLQRWKGGSVDVDVDQELVDTLTARLRQEVQVCEVDAVLLGSVPETMIGWWVSSSFAALYAERAGDGTTEGRGDE